MRLDEKSVVSYWHMDENLQIWPEFDSYNPNDLCQFLDMNDFDKVKEELKSLIAKGKFSSTKEAFNAYKDGNVKIKLSEPELEKFEKAESEKEKVTVKIEEPSPKEQKNKATSKSMAKKSVKKASSKVKTKSSPKKNKPKTTKKETKVSVKEK